MSDRSFSRHRDNNFEVNRVLQALDPLHGEVQEAGYDQRAREDLQDILSSHTFTQAFSHPAGVEKTSPSRRWILRGGAIAAAAGVVAAAGVLQEGTGWPFGTSGGSAYAATPPPLKVADPVPTSDGLPTVTAGSSAQPVLLAMARRLRENSSLRSAEFSTGEYAKVTLREWSLSTTIDGDRVTSSVTPVESTTWVASNGAGKMDSREDGATATRSDVSDFSFSIPFGETVTSPAELAAEWGARGAGGFEKFMSFTDASREQPLSGLTLASALEYLSSSPEILAQGYVVDRLGRIGYSVYVDSARSGLPTRYVGVFDTGTGQLLAAEQTLTKDAGKLNVPIPSVIAYTCYVESAFVAALGD